MNKILVIVGLLFTFTSSKAVKVDSTFFSGFGKVWIYNKTSHIDWMHYKGAGQAHGTAALVLSLPTACRDSLRPHDRPR